MHRTSTRWKHHVVIFVARQNASCRGRLLEEKKKRSGDDDGCGTAEQRTAKRENKNKTQNPRPTLTANEARVRWKGLIYVQFIYSILHGQDNVAWNVHERYSKDDAVHRRACSFRFFLEEKKKHCGLYLVLWGKVEKRQERYYNEIKFSANPSNSATVCDFDVTTIYFNPIYSVLVLKNLVPTWNVYL